MVAKITVPNSIKKALNYNEQKVKEGKAICINAHNFLKEVECLNFHEKLGRFEALIALNKRAATNTVHISLNFGIAEKLDQNKLAEIATVYMHKIGFNEQPYLVYHHLDAGHPHIHIVTTNVRNDGQRISLHNMGRNQSNQARKEIEIAYGLTKAEEQQKHHWEEIKPLNIQKVVYGKLPTKRAITNVLDHVLLRYRYTSLAELNAVLGLYNLIADRGKEDGPIYKKRGLIYRILDGNGHKVGVPIKASSIYNKPTLNFLEQRFKENESLKQEHKKFLKTSIDWILVKSPNSLHAFKNELERNKINLVIRQNEGGIIYGLTYVDHNTKSVFNGSDIGKDYSAKAILNKCGPPQLTPEETKSINPNNSLKITSQADLENPKAITENLAKIFDMIIAPTEQYTNLPSELRRKKKRKRKSK
jgi:hypothetical protein